MRLTEERCGEDVDREKNTRGQVHQRQNSEEEAGNRRGSGGAVTVDERVEGGGDQRAEGDDQDGENFWRGRLFVVEI